MSAKHTPGPWRIDHRYGEFDEAKDEWVEDAGDVSRIAGPDGQHVCGTCDGCNKIKPADAKLIAAASPLADALERLYEIDSEDIAHFDFTPEYAEALRAAHAALRAAGRLGGEK